MEYTLPEELARQVQKERFSHDELRRACREAGEGLGRQDAREARFRAAAKMVEMWRGLDLPAWEAPYVLREARLGYLNGYERALVSGELPKRETARAAESRWGEGWQEKLGAARERAKEPIDAPDRMLPSPGAHEARRRAMNVKLYNTQRCPYARRTRMVLHEKGIDFETYEVDLANKSEEFLSVSPTSKVPVIVVDGESIYESNVVNQYLDEVTDEPKLMPEDPKLRARARIWMAFADTNFFPAVFVASVGRDRGFPEARISEALEQLKAALGKLEERLRGRDYLADGFSLADVAYAGNFVRLRELEERGEVSLGEYPNVAAWIERLEGRDSYEAAV